MNIGLEVFMVVIVQTVAPCSIVRRYQCWVWFHFLPLMGISDTPSLKSAGVTESVPYPTQCSPNDG
jgi:hypothetical protein